MIERGEEEEAPDTRDRENDKRALGGTPGGAIYVIPDASNVLCCEYLLLLRGPLMWIVSSFFSFIHWKFQSCRLEKT